MKDLIRKILKESEENDFDWIESPFGVDTKVIEYLENNYDIGRYKSFKSGGLYDGLVYIEVDGKTYFIDGNKKYLLDKLYNELIDVFSYVNKPILRRSIRHYLNDINN